MPTSLEYMQFATGVYAASLNNKIDDPAGWNRTAWQPDQGSGFSAGYYFNSQSNEVVISKTTKGVSIAFFFGAAMPRHPRVDCRWSYSTCRPNSEQ